MSPFLPFAKVPSPHVRDARLERQQSAIFVFAHADQPSRLTIAPSARASPLSRHGQCSIPDAVPVRIDHRTRRGRRPGEAGEQEMVAVPLVVAAKLALYTAMREQGLTKVGLARRPGLSEGAVRKRLNPNHGSTHRADRKSARKGGAAARSGRTRPFSGGGRPVPTSFRRRYVTGRTHLASAT